MTSVTVTVDLSREEVAKIRINAINRVINSAIRNARHCENHHPDALRREQANENLQDLEDLKYVLNKLWMATQSSLLFNYPEL